MNPFLLPKRARDATARAGADLRERGCQVWLDARRRGVAGVLRLALDGGWLAEDALDAAFEGATPHQALYRLLLDALAGVPPWIEAVARRHALDPAAWPDWHPWVRLDLLDAEEGARLELTLEQLWTHTFHLDDLPPALAVAVARTLDLIGRRLTECVLARDLAEWWFDESEPAYRDIAALGHADPAARWAAARADTEWGAWFGWDDRAAFDGWWARMAAYCEPEPVWLRRWRARAAPADTAAALRGLTRRLWRWRRVPGLARAPWFRWLRRAVATLRRAVRRWPAPPARGVTVETDAQPLAHAQSIGFAEPWEEALLEEFYECLANGSEDVGWALRADPDTPALADALEALAIGQGLLVGASQADARTRGQPFP